MRAKFQWDACKQLALVHTHMNEEAQLRAISSAPEGAPPVAHSDAWHSCDQPADSVQADASLIGSVLCSESTYKTIFHSFTEDQHHGLTAQMSDLQRSAEKRISWRLLPVLLLLTVVSFIDRTNLAFASVQMNQDLNLSGSIYGLGSGMFFLGYAAFQVTKHCCVWLLVLLQLPRAMARLHLCP